MSKRALWWWVNSYWKYISFISGAKSVPKAANFQAKASRERNAILILEYHSRHCTYLSAPCVPLCHVSLPLLDLPFHHHLLLKWKMNEWSSSNNNIAHPPQDMAVNMVGICSSAKSLPYSSDVTMYMGPHRLDGEGKMTLLVSTLSLFSILLGEVTEGMCPPIDLWTRPRKSSEAPHPFPYLEMYDHHSHSGSHFKDAALREWVVVETIWQLYVTEPWYVIHTNFWDSGRQVWKPSCLTTTEDKPHI